MAAACESAARAAYRTCGGYDTIDGDDRPPTKAYALLGFCAFGFLVIIGGIVTIAVLVAGEVGSKNNEAEAYDSPAGYLADKTSLSFMQARLSGLMDIAREHPNMYGVPSRATEYGYNASAQYVASYLKKAGYKVTEQHLPVPLFTQLANPTLSLVSATGFTGGVVEYIYGLDFKQMRYGGSGYYNFTAEIAIADNYGCNTTDYTDVAGKIVLIQNGGECNYYVKAFTAQSLNAAGLLFYTSESGSAPTSRLKNDYWDPSQQLIDIPSLGVTGSLASVFKDILPASVHMSSNTSIVIQDTYNILTETKGGDEKHTVIAGAHLDSVAAGPGINDDGSGSVALLSLAVNFANYIESEGAPVNKVKFAWWACEENGLLGSRYFVSNLTPDEKENIALNVNFDMLASPNFVRYVHGGDLVPDGTPNATVEGSLAIEKVFGDYFDSVALPYERTGMTGGSDYYPFILAGIPAGGLATGAGGIKSDEERKVYGGFANAQYDPCYHQPCDTTDNISEEALLQMARAAAHTVGTFAYDKNVAKTLKGN